MIKGEKLYVTQDKRENLAGSKKKCCCGVVAVLVLGAAIAIIVAVLLTQEGTGLSQKEARNYNEAGFGGLIPTPPPPMPPDQPRPTTDMSEMFLRNVLEGKLTIDNMQFTPGLSDSSSAEFNNLAVSLEEEIKKALFDHRKLHFGASDISVKVINFSTGSVIVTYRVGWRFKDGIHDPSDPIDMDALKAKLQKHLQENGGFLYHYRIPVHSIMSTRVIDECQRDNYGCAKGCLYNSTTLQITCTCPLGFKLHEDGKTCAEIDLMETHGFDYPSSSEPSYIPVEESSPETSEDTNVHHPHDHSSYPFSENYPEEPPYYPGPESSSHQPDEFLWHHLPEDTLDHHEHESHDHEEGSDHREHGSHHEEGLNRGEETGNDDPEEASIPDYHPNNEHPEEPVVHPFETTVKYEHNLHMMPPQENFTQTVIQPEQEFPVVVSEPTDHSETPEPTKPPSVESSEHPITFEPSHDHSMEYLPEPTIIPVKSEQDVSSEHSVTFHEEHPMNKSDDFPSVLTTGLSTEKSVEMNATNDMTRPLEYLPEYSTYSDSAQDSLVTENSVKSSTAESPAMDSDINIPITEEGKVTDENKETHSEIIINQEHSTTTEAAKMESSENPVQHTSEETPIPNSELNVGASLLENNNAENKTNVDESREELIDHMPNTDMNTTESMSSIPVIQPSEQDKTSNYSGLMNDIHSIEGNPFETERLNELPSSNESTSEANVDHSYFDLHHTEKPIEHNVIETFREAKATDFTNSTDIESTRNLTVTEVQQEKQDSNEMTMENVSTVSTSNISSTVSSDPAIFVTPSYEDDRKNVADNLSSNSSTERIIPVTELVDEEIPDAGVKMHEGFIDESSFIHSTETPQSGNKVNDSPDEVKLVKTTEESEIKLPSSPDQMTEIKKVMEEQAENKEETATVIDVMKSANDEQESGATTMHPNMNEDLSKPSLVEVTNATSSASEQNHDSTIFVTQPPQMAVKVPENDGMKQEEMPMISITEIPDLMGPFPVDTVIKQNPEIEKEQNNDKSLESLRDRPNVYSRLDDDSNNLNSLEDDYENDNHKSKYQKQGKSKLLKNFNVKEIYPDHNSSEKDVSHLVDAEKTVEMASSSPETSSIQPTSESVNHLLSDESYTTLTPLFTSKQESMSPSSTTTEKIEEPMIKEIKSDHGLFSSEAYTTLSPLFHSGSSSQPTTNMKIEEITTTTPLIFDLIEGKKIDPNANEFDNIPVTTQSVKDSDVIPADKIILDSDKKNESTVSVNSEDAPKVESGSDSPMNEPTYVKESAADRIDADMMTTIVPDEKDLKMADGEDKIETVPLTTVIPPSSSESTLNSETETIKPVEKSDIKEVANDQPATETYVPMTEMPLEDKKELSTEEPATEIKEITTELPTAEMKEQSTENPIAEIKEPSTENPIAEIKEPSTELPIANMKDISTELPMSADIKELSTDLPQPEMKEHSTERPLAEMKEPATAQPTTALPESMTLQPGMEINDSVVKLLMNSTYPNSTLYSKCASGQWACLDGSGCIAPNSRCDSDKDCLDGSDEANCQEQGCPGNFQCASGECLKRHLVCDSVSHCSDGSDEINCESWKCNFDEMQCLPSSRKCIPSLWKCDNIAHCPNNEDEYGCKDSCRNDEFFCAEGWCIPLSKKCDGKSDCAKGEDELNCLV